MESSGLNASHDHEAALTAMLRRPASAIPDDGFSARVLAALPPPRPTVFRVRRRWPWTAYIVGSLAGSAFACFRAGNWTDFASGMRQLANALSVVFTTLSEPWLLLALGLVALSLLIALPFTRSQGRLG